MYKYIFDLRCNNSRPSHGTFSWGGCTPNTPNTSAEWNERKIQYAWLWSEIYIRAMCLCVSAFSFWFLFCAVWILFSPALAHNARCLSMIQSIRNIFTLFARVYYLAKHRLTMHYSNRLLNYENSVFVNRQLRRTFVFIGIMITMATYIPS